MLVFCSQTLEIGLEEATALLEIQEVRIPNYQKVNSQVIGRDP